MVKNAMHFLLLQEYNARKSTAPSGSGATTSKKRIYCSWYDELLFLIPTIKTRPTTSSHDIDISDDEETENLETTQPDKNLIKRPKRTQVYSLNLQLFLPNVESRDLHSLPNAGREWRSKYHADCSE